jgi:putative sigma-54 modulation protein
MAQRIQLSEKEHHINVTIFGKNIEVTTPIKNYILEKVEKVEHMNQLGINMTVRLDIQKLDHNVEIIMKFSHFKIQVHATTLEMYSAIDKAFDRLKAKIRKWKGKIQDHHAKGVSVVDLHVHVLESRPTELQEINDQIEEENLKKRDEEYRAPKVYKQKTRSLKTLNLDEAVMKMELSKDNFLIYRSEEDLKLKVLYRRKDDSYGVIVLVGDR